MNTFTVIKSNNVSHLHPSWRWHREGDNIIEALTKVFETLSYSSLCICATVSKTWRKLVVNELQSRCTVTVKNVSQIQFVLEKLKNCANFRVEKCFIKFSILDSLLVKQMLFGMQNTLSILHLEILFTRQRTYLFQAMKNLPNVTQLSVTFIFSDDSSSSSVECDGPNQYCHPDFAFLCRRDSIPTPSEQEVWSHTNESHIRGSDPNLRFDFSRNMEESTYIHQNVRHLHFDLGPNAQFQLSKVFHAFPNVVELNISNIVHEPFKLLKSPYKKLKYFTVRQYSNISFYDKLIQTLLKLGLCLESLMLILPPPTKSEPNLLQGSAVLLKQFIETQRASLKSLKLIQVEDDCHFLSFNSTSTNISMQNVATRRGSASTDTQDICTYWNFNYTSPSISLLPINLTSLEVLHVQKPLISNLAQVLKHFPKLKRLSVQVSPNGSNWRGMLPQNLESHKGITAFKLDFIDPDSFSRLVTCFPSLQTLQLAYCDKSLFSVLRKQIPCFNTAIAKKNYTSCTECHGKVGQNCSLNRTRKEKDQSGQTDDGNYTDCSFPANKVFQGSKNPTPFQNLKLLRMRPCRHFPYENIVFLQHGSSETPQFADLEAMKFGDAWSDEFDSSFGFSWRTAGVMKDKEFIDMPLYCPDSNESCSSA